MSMRSCTVFTHSMTSEQLAAVVADRELNGRALTSTCRLYELDGTAMITAPESFALPRHWTGGDVIYITVADDDLAAVALTEHEHLLAHEIVT
jgi:hypothetical protein